MAFRSPYSGLSPSADRVKDKRVLLAGAPREVPRSREIMQRSSSQRRANKMADRLAGKSRLDHWCRRRTRTRAAVMFAPGRTRHCRGRQGRRGNETVQMVRAAAGRPEFIAADVSKAQQVEGRGAMRGEKLRRPNVGSPITGNRASGHARAGKISCVLPLPARNPFGFPLPTTQPAPPQMVRICRRCS